MQRRSFLAGSVAMMGMGTAQAAPSGMIVPAEDVKHACTFMQWPVSRDAYPGRGQLRKTQATIAEIANTIADFEPVIMLADAQYHEAIRSQLSSKVELWNVPTDDLWCRDSGPLFLSNGRGKLAVSHIQFNGWGDRASYQHDGRVAERVADRLGLDLIPSGLRGEPGGVEQDGHGLLIAHASSWVNPNRNPGLSQAEIGQRLCRAYGADRIVWSDGVAGQDVTDYHIDGLARFTKRNEVLINLPQRPKRSDDFHMAALDTYDALVAAGIKVNEIADPQRTRVKRWDFVAAYVNYYVCNGGVLASHFGDPGTDQAAANALARHYPGREVVMLNTDALGKLGGGIHCATQQMPAT
ncbi:MAG: agmatine deiminase family protein [Paracoccaceae bacterium]